MKIVSVVPVLFAAAVVAAGVHAGDEVDQTKDAASDGLVKIVNVRGEVEVIGWDKDEIEIEGELDDTTKDFIFDVDDDSAHIEVKIPRFGANWGDGSDLTIHVPRGSRVSVEGASSDTTLRGIAGGVRVRSASGDIIADDIGTQLNLKTVSGEIEVEDSSGTANISSVSGEIDIEIDSRNILLDTVSGEIEAELGEFERLRANAVSGDLKVEGQLVSGGDIEMATVSGDLVLRLIQPVDARVEVETGPGGDISNHLSDDEVEKRFPSMNGLRARLGDGSGHINLRTVSGDIELDNVD